VDSDKNKVFIDLYTPVHIGLTHFCRAISGNLADAEDLMNDAILATLENMDKLKDINSFRPYIFSIASNLNKMRLRRGKFHAEFTENEIATLMDTSYHPEHAADLRIIYEHMLSLGGRMAESLILFHISDLSLEDIQKIQGGSLSGVKLRLKRGRNKLLQSLNSKNQQKMALFFFNL
jgi:RNA polymerase sigma-70 factor (ECF subfamily)